jgi:Carboxypeptidase regulatory-like domain
LVAVLGAVLALAPLTAPAHAGEKPRKAAPATALIAGTVFRDDGRALAGAQLVLAAHPDEGSKPKVKRISAVSDSRGEFAIRIPALAMRYDLSATAAGFEVRTQPVAIQGEDRVDLTIVLAPRAK